MTGSAGVTYPGVAASMREFTFTGFSPRTMQEREAFVLYVEGPRDRDVLRAWSFRLHPPLGRALARQSLILGGRQPDRAAAHFERLHRENARARGLCVLDRDGADGFAPPLAAPGLEFHVWGRRHIESYLLVPDAIRRSLRLPADDHRVTRACRDLLPPLDDESALRDLDAKRLLAADGELARAIGIPLRPGRIAREMREEELHPEVRGVVERAVAGFHGT